MACAGAFRYSTAVPFAFNRLVKDEAELIAEGEAVDGRYILLAAGKKNKMVLELV